MATPAQRHAGICGYTLLESMLALFIITLMATMGVPAWRALVAGNSASAATALYLHAFASARHAAVATARNVTLCPLDSAGRCSGRWQEPLTIFYDDNRDGRLGADADIIDVVKVAWPQRARIELRAFGQRRYLSLRATGHYRQNGTLRICFDGSNGRAIVINAAGRTRVERWQCSAAG